QPIDDLRKCYFVIFFNLQLGTAAMYYNYSAIEEEIEKNKDHPIFAPLYFPSELHRRDALAKNLEYLYGEDWESKISCSAATQPYVDHIHKVGRDDPVLLVAHAWTYYMGDLSRGPVLKKVAQRALKLPPTGEGVNFYHFEGIHNPTAFKRDTKRKNKCPYHAARMGEEWKSFTRWVTLWKCCCRSYKYVKSLTRLLIHATYL
uniref:Heme oxygenase 2a n=1 Tax=Cyprinus carpio TaxID=7962 RepID=A0A8C1W3L6_CYPCA